MMSAVQSPLFEPVLWHARGFKILDEILLPEEVSYIEVNAVAQAIDAVRGMKTRAFGQVLTFLYSGALLAQSHAPEDAAALSHRLSEMTQQFSLARPTFDFEGLAIFFEDWLSKLPAGAPAGEAVAEQARVFARQIVHGRLVRAQLAASILPNPTRLLTHCNVSGELVAVAQYCKASGKEVSVIAGETRPYLQGARLTAWELAQAGVAVSVIPDCAVAQVLANGDANAIIVGADRVAQNGDVINKVGTYPLALMAKEYGVPFHALIQDPRSLATGAEVEIEERPSEELLSFQGESLVPGSGPGLMARYPAFDVTPAALISHLIGFDALYTPDEFRRKYQTETGHHAVRAGALGQYILVYGIPPRQQQAFLHSALKAERAESVLVPEMRPQLWGAQVVARELLQRQIPVTLISDSMMGTLFAQGEIRKLCLFYDDLTETGPKAICGALLAAQLARQHGVPVELFSAATQPDVSRDRDVTTFLGRSICPPGVAARATGAEVIPWSLLKA
jgi:methylthioribose-1-phosphate isomerase